MNSKTYIIISLFLLAIFLSVFKLRESPPMWMDEGIIIQSARSFADIGYPAIPVAPGVYESAGPITTSYPVTLPIAISFKMFGVGLMQARFVMVLYLVLFFIASYYLLKKFVSPEKYIYIFALFITFAPIYGHGKNVLGEVPGMFFFFVFLIAMYFYEKSNYKNIYLAMATGLFSGLFIVTKPIFILFIPALVVSYFIKRFWYNNGSSLNISIRDYIIFFVSMIIPIIFWITTQFGGDSLANVLSHYSDPYKVNLFEVFKQNIYLFYTDFQPLYFLMMFIVWMVAISIRLYKKDFISFAELLSFIFSGLVFLAFFRTPGYYRYFFPAQLMCIIYFIPGVEILIARTKIFVSDAKRLVIIMFCLLFLLHAYSLFFTSWVAKSYSSKRTEVSEEYFLNFTDEKVFLYQVPELAIFIKPSSTYQFFNAAPQLPFGLQSLAALSKEIPDVVIVNSDMFGKNSEMFKQYKVAEKVGRYSILRK